MKYMLKYTHPAAPKDRRIVVNDVYDLEFLKTIYTMERIEIFFTPIDFKFEDLNLKEEVKESSIVLNKSEDFVKSDKDYKTQYNNYPLSNKK